MRIDPDYLLDTLAGLVGTDSTNPDLVSGGAGESEIADRIEKSLSGLGLQVRRHEPRPGRVSVVGILKGAASGPSLMLNAHCDTVGVEGMQAPFSAQIRDGRLYGRGSYDMKGSLAAGLAAVKALLDSGRRPAGDLLVAAVADEEYASLGTSDLIGRYQVDAAIVTEPTELRICRAHKGFVWLNLETTGRAYHGSRFDKGIDAIMRMGRFLSRLEGLERELRTRPAHHLVGPPSLHAATIEGGTSLSVYSGSCRLGIERRTIPGESEGQVLAEIGSILDDLRAEDPAFQAELKTTLVREPFEVGPEARIVKSIERASEDVLGTVPAHVGQNPWMDSALLSSAGVETVVMGPSGAGAHSDEEWVDLESVEKLASILALAALDYCGEG